MASHALTEAPVKRQRKKKIARPNGLRIDPKALVAEIYATFPEDMARLAE